MAFILSRTRPDKEKDRVAWNSSWERDLARKYGLQSFNYPTLTSLVSTSFLRGLLSDSVQIALDNEVRQLCDLQQDMSRFAIAKFAEEDFEGAWKEIGTAKRAELVLEGIYRAACVNIDMEDHRQWTPELNVEKLSGGDGEGYLALLKELLPDDADKVITEPIFVPHPVVDQIFRVSDAELERMPGLKTARRMLLLRRMLFLSLAVWNTLLAFVRHFSSGLTITPSILTTVFV